MFRVSGPQGLCLGFQGPAFRVSRPQGLCLGFQGPAFRVSRPQGLCLGFQGLNAVFFQVSGFFKVFQCFFKVFPCFFGFFQGFSEEGLPPRPFDSLISVKGGSYF